MEGEEVAEKENGRQGGPTIWARGRGISRTPTLKSLPPDKLIAAECHSAAGGASGERHRRRFLLEMEQTMLARG